MRWRGSFKGLRRWNLLKISAPLPLIKVWRDLSKVISGCPRIGMSWLGIEPRPPQWASTLEESHSNSLIIAIWNIYIWALDQWRMLLTGLPSACVTWTYMNSEHTWTTLWCRPNSTCKASAKHLPAAKTLALASPRFTVKQGRSHRGHHYEETWPRSSRS